MTLTTTSRLAAVLLALLTVQASADNDRRDRARWVPVSGTGVHYFSTAIIHSTTPTDVGFIQRSTDTVELDGDLKGRVIYHPTSVFDFAAGTLVNTGNQVFSGTILGSEPVLIHDDRFRFEVNLFDGRTVGKIFLTDSIAGPRIRCRLAVDGVGEETETGDARFTYTGACRIPAERRRNRWRKQD